MKAYKLKTDLPGHTGEIYCDDLVTVVDVDDSEVLSGSRDRSLGMWVLVSLSFCLVGLELTLPVQLEESNAESLDWGFVRSCMCGGVA